MSLAAGLDFSFCIVLLWKSFRAEANPPDSGRSSESRILTALVPHIRNDPIPNQIRNAVAILPRSPNGRRCECLDNNIGGNPNRCLDRSTRRQNEPFDVRRTALFA